MTRAQTIGKIGEDAAAAYLVKNQYRIVERNHLKPWGELDIVAIAKNKTLVFVEVKTLTGLRPYETGYGPAKPEDNMTSAKIIKTKRASLAYANSHPKLITGRGWRIDVIAVTITENALNIRHYENI